MKALSKVLAALLSGALFGVGLAVSRMTDPRVVLGFLDPSGRFDPTLAFALGGAAGTTLVTFRWVLRRARPVLDEDFRLPLKDAVDPRLVVGAAIFGIGWGLAGYCPAPALVGAAGGVDTALVFVPAMLLGMLLQRVFDRRVGRTSASALARS